MVPILEADVALLPSSGIDADAYRVSIASDILAGGQFIRLGDSPNIKNPTMVRTLMEAK